MGWAFVVVIMCGGARGWTRYRAGKRQRLAWRRCSVAVVKFAAGVAFGTTISLLSSRLVGVSSTLLFVAALSRRLLLLYSSPTGTRRRLTLLLLSSATHYSSPTVPCWYSLASSLVAYSAATAYYYSLLPFIAYCLSLVAYSTAATLYSPRLSPACSTLLSTAPCSAARLLLLAAAY